MEINKAIIIGKGAVGSTMGSFLHKGLGKENFAFVMDSERKEKYEKNPGKINGETVDFNFVDNPDEFGKADLILICTKYSGLPEALELARPFVKDETIFMSGINGIKSEEDIQKAYPGQAVLRTIAQKMDSTYMNGDVVFSTPGELVFGSEKEDQKQAEKAVIDLFEKCSLPYVCSEDILYDQYKKLMANCGINQVCAAFDIPYGMVVRDPEYLRLYIRAMEEVKETANTYGIPLTEKDVDEWVDSISKLAPDSMPSMLQDLRAGRKSELELFSGTVVPMAREKGIETPVLGMLMEKIREIEKEDRFQK